ncbi:MAG: 2-amino-4-hydroxy-6-hydroxymethyldihydropteridine diphosphokinase [Rickettsiales bacterium]|nr:2-amino-4-hydroxy-6-hydroxymethyldihydropteridine diphosphokinase [Rickettsiales bacterium]
MVQHTVILGLGSNCHSREHYLGSGLAELRSLAGLSHFRLSSIYENPALLPPDAPVEWDQPFLNMVAVMQSSYEPLQLLSLTQKIEQKIGRVARGRWGPREIDIDLLDCSSMICHGDQLTLPHPHMLERDFVMIPLAELQADWIHPHDHSKQTAKDYADHFWPLTHMRRWPVQKDDIS